MLFRSVEVLGVGFSIATCRNRCQFAKRRKRCLFFRFLPYCPDNILCNYIIQITIQYGIPHRKQSALSRHALVPAVSGKPPSSSFFPQRCTTSVKQTKTTSLLFCKEVVLAYWKSIPFDRVFLCRYLITRRYRSIYYLYINSSYWQAHFYTYWRLP